MNEDDPFQQFKNLMILALTFTVFYLFYLCGFALGFASRAMMN